MPELGGSYFTFSNENNYLIWSFLAECKGRGWLYKGHDTMPWCARCGTGISQHEMTEGYAVREGEDLFWVSRGVLKNALVGPFQVVEEKAGRELAGWRYAGPFDELPAVQAAFAVGASAVAVTAPYEHRVVVWDEVGEEEGTGIVHIAPGCGAEDFALGKSLGLPMIAPLDENGVVIAGFGSYTGRDVRDVCLL